MTDEQKTPPPGCLCAEIHPTDRPCLVCEAAAVTIGTLETKDVAEMRATFEQATLTLDEDGRCWANHRKFTEPVEVAPHCQKCKKPLTLTTEKREHCRACFAGENAGHMHARCNECTPAGIWAIVEIRVS